MNKNDIKKRLTSLSLAASMLATLSACKKIEEVDFRGENTDTPTYYITTPSEVTETTLASTYKTIETMPSTDPVMESTAKPIEVPESTIIETTVVPETTVIETTPVETTTIIATTKSIETETTYIIEETKQPATNTVVVETISTTATEESIELTNDEIVVNYVESEKESLLDKINKGADDALEATMGFLVMIGNFITGEGTIGGLYITDVSEPVAEFVVNVGNKLDEELVKVYPDYKEDASSVWDVIKDGVSYAWGEIKNAPTDLKDNWEKLKGYF